MLKPNIIIYLNISSFRYDFDENLRNNLLSVLKIYCLIIEFYVNFLQNLSGPYKKEIVTENIQVFINGRLNTVTLNLRSLIKERAFN